MNAIEMKTGESVVSEPEDQVEEAAPGGAADATGVLAATGEPTRGRARRRPIRILLRRLIPPPPPPPSPDLHINNSIHSDLIHSTRRCALLGLFLFVFYSFSM